MKHFLLFVALFLFLTTAAAPAKAVFVEGLEDIPIPDGLHQIENGNLNFGNEEIRLIEAYLTSKYLSFGDIAAFYKETLPQMGWQSRKRSYDRMVFDRDGETMEIAKESENPLVIRLTVKSKLQ